MSAGVWYQRGAGPTGILQYVFIVGVFKLFHRAWIETVFSLSCAHAGTTIYLVLIFLWKICYLMEFCFFSGWCEEAHESVCCIYLILGLFSKCFRHLWHPSNSTYFFSTKSQTAGLHHHTFLMHDVLMCCSWMTHLWRWPRYRIYSSAVCWLYDLHSLTNVVSHYGWSKYITTG